MNVTIITSFPYKETVVEYTDFKELMKKHAGSNPQYRFPSAEQALTEFKNGATCVWLDYQTCIEIEKLTKPIIYGGLKLNGYFRWDKSVFLMLAAFITYVGETTESL